MYCVVYDSRGGTTKGVANNVAEFLGIESMDVKDILRGDKPFGLVKGFIFFTYTDKVGGVSKRTREFLTEHGDKMLGVVANGSSDFKAMGMFAIAGDIIAKEYNVDILAKLDRGGTYEDAHNIVSQCVRIFGYKQEKVAYKPDITKRVGGLLQLERM